MSQSPGERAPLIKRKGAHLPHWRRDGATYALTFRLADSLPAHVLERWRDERSDIVQRAELMGRPLTTHEVLRLRELHCARVERWLNRGHGCCAMKDPRVARLVVNALHHFDESRYDLLAWCVMPNHVHAVLRPHPNWELSKILLSWKGFTGKKARELLGTIGDGAFWQRESYDHIVRDADDLAYQIKYVLRNPRAAGLVDWPWVGRRNIALSGNRTSNDAAK